MHQNTPTPSETRIALARRLMDRLDKTGLLCAFVASSAARGDATETSDLDIRLVHRKPATPFRQYATMEEGICVEWVWEPRENYSDVEALLDHFAAPYNLRTGVAVYDPDGWLAGLKATVGQLAYDPEWVRRRVLNLWGSVGDSRSKLRKAVAVGDYAGILRAYLGFLDITAIPVAATTQDPSARKRLVQAKAGLGLLGLGHGAAIIDEMYGATGLTPEAAGKLLRTMMRLYDCAMLVQAADYHGINGPKRDYHLQGISAMIGDGMHREAVYPILDWATVAEYRIRTDTGRSGWWTRAYESIIGALGMDPGNIGARLDAAELFYSLYGDAIVSVGRVWVPEG